VIQGVYPGVTTSELDELAAQTSAYMSTQHPDFSKLAARISVSNLHKQTEKVCLVVCVCVFVCLCVCGGVLFCFFSIPRANQLKMEQTSVVVCITRHRSLVVHEVWRPYFQPGCRDKRFFVSILIGSFCIEIDGVVSPVASPLLSGPPR